MSTADTTTGRLRLSDNAKEQAYSRMEKADEGDLNRQITGMVILRFCGAGLGIIFLVVNAYQATWALMKLAGMAGGGGVYDAVTGEAPSLSADQWAIGATAFGIILAAQVVAVRLVMAKGAWKFWGVLLLLGLMAFSVITSAIHVGFNIQGGVVAATRQTDDYALAKKRYESAISGKTTAETNWSNYQNDMRGGDPWSLNATHSQGPGRPYVEGINSAKSELEAARRSFEEVKANGGGSGMADIIGTIAKFFGTDTAGFALGFGIFTVLLMEGVRVYLSLLTGIYLMQVMDEIGRKRANGSGQGDVIEDDSAPEKSGGIRSWFSGFGKSDTEAGEAIAKKPEPAPRAQVMPASASGSVDTVRGPVLRDPIEVEEKRDPRAMIPKRSPRQSAPADRVPDNKRQVAYSKKLAALKAAVGPGKAFAPGDAVTVERVGKLIGGNRKTVSALRNDLASDGLAHWQGKRLISGAA